MEKKQNVLAPERFDGGSGGGSSSSSSSSSGGGSNSNSHRRGAGGEEARAPAAALVWDWAALGVADGDEDEAEYTALAALLRAVCPAFFRGDDDGGAMSCERVRARRVESALRLEGAALYDAARRLVPAARLAPATRRRVAALARQYLEADAEEEVGGTGNDDDDAGSAALRRAVVVDVRRCRHAPSVARLVDVGAAPASAPPGNFF